MGNPMSKSTPWSLVAEGYAKYTLPMFQQFSLAAVKLSKFTTAENILDIACGPGTMSLEIKDKVKSIEAIDFSEEMLLQFDKTIAKKSIKNINTQKMDGQNLSFEDNYFDYAFSMFGLMFFPDRIKGFKEIFRVLKPGGKAIVSSWAPVSQSPLMSLMFNSMIAAYPERKKPQDNMLNLENPKLFEEEMKAAGFHSIKIHKFTGLWTIENIEEFFYGMIEGSAPIVMMRQNMSNEEWVDKSQKMIKSIRQKLPKLPTTLGSKAYIGIGVKN